MSDLFKSTEIRWFSPEREPLESLFRSLPGEFEVNAEERTDHYLNTKLTSAGIKIREGKHEIKVKRETEEFLEGIGTVEHWAKWSISEEKNILNTINQNQLTDWIAIEKKRWLKLYSVSDSRDSVLPVKRYLPDGCGVEFTEIRIADLNYFTFGLEAWGSKFSSRENLELVFQYLNLKQSDFEGLDCMGYPEFLSKNL